MISRVQGRIQEIQNRMGAGTLASYLDTVSFIENSLKIIQNFREKGRGWSP